jgi:hypothetical protein
MITGMSSAVSRPLTPREAPVLAVMLNGDAVGVDELRARAQRVSARDFADAGPAPSVKW